MTQYKIWEKIIFVLLYFTRWLIVKSTNPESRCETFSGAINSSLLNGCDHLIVCSDLSHREWFLEPNSLVNNAPGNVRNICLTIKDSEISRLKKDNLAFQSSVTRLLFENDNITRIDPNTFHQDFAENIELLSLKNNPLDNLDMAFFESLTNLKELDLSHTKLKYYEDLGFNGADPIRLETLTLTGSDLVVFNESLTKNPEHQRTLQKLNLSDNKLESISLMEDGMFSNVEVLDLSGNQLTYLENSGIFSLKNLKDLRLQDNPWHCDCKILDMSVQLNKTQFINMDERFLPRCREPLVFQNLTIFQIHWYLSFCNQTVENEPPEAPSNTKFQVTVSVISISTFVAFVLVVSGLAYLYRQGRIVIPRQTQGDSNYMFMEDDSTLSYISSSTFSSRQS